MKNLANIFLCLMLAFGASAVLAQSGGSSHIPPDIAAELSRGGININPSESGVVPVIAILSVFGTPVMITGIIVLGWYNRQKRRMSLMEKIVESGQPIPEGLLNGEMDAAAKNSSLRKGVTSLGAGAGILVFGFFVSKTLMAIGAIPVCMGLAYLLLWKLENKSEEDSSTI